MKLRGNGIMLDKYSNLLKNTMDSYQYGDYKTRFNLSKELLHDVKVSLVTEFFLQNEDDIRRFYGDVENLKEEKTLNILSPKAVFNFFNDYLNGMIKYVESNKEDSSQSESIRQKSIEFIEKIFTKDESNSLSIEDAMTTLNDYIWFKNVGIDLLEDVMEKFETIELNDISKENFSNLLSHSIISFVYKFMNLCEENFNEMKEAVK